MTIREFHNCLRLLHSIDSHEVGDPEWYSRFAAKPVLFFISCDDETAALIWAAMEKRTKPSPAAALNAQMLAALKLARRSMIVSVTGISDGLTIYDIKQWVEMADTAIAAATETAP